MFSIQPYPKRKRASYRGRTYGSSFSSKRARLKKPGDSPPQLHRTFASTMRLASLRLSDAIAITIRYVLPVPAGPRAKVTVCSNSIDMTLLSSGLVRRLPLGRHNVVWKARQSQGQLLRSLRNQAAYRHPKRWSALPS